MMPCDPADIAQKANHMPVRHTTETMGSASYQSLFLLNNSNIFCVVDYHSKYPLIKCMKGLSAESLITSAEYGKPCRLMSNASSSGPFRQHCYSFMGTVSTCQQAVSSVSHHQSNRFK